MNGPESIDWNRIIGKEARSKDDEDYGEVKEVREGHVITERGIIEKDKFVIPKNKVYGFDGHTLWLDIPGETRAEFLQPKEHTS